MNTKEILNVVRHFDLGGLIESKIKSIECSEWMIDNNPTWDFSKYDYRVASPLLQPKNTYTPPSGMTIKEKLLSEMDEGELRIIYNCDNVLLISLEDNIDKTREDGTYNTLKLNIEAFNIDDNYQNNKKECEGVIDLLHSIKYRIIGSCKHKKYDIEISLVDCEKEEN